MADEELWHVRISPDEVKILTLEQLDDLFRLEVIEADALVWQPGMDEWLPLSVVAGMGDDEPGPSVSIPVSEPPPATTQRRVGATTAVGWPPAPALPSARPAPPPLSQRPVPGAPSARPAPPPLSQRPVPGASSARPAPPPLSQRPVPGAAASLSAPLPLSQRPAPPARAGAGSSYPAPASWVDPNPVASVSPLAATVQAGQFPLYAESSTAPSVADIQMGSRARSGGSLVIALALAAGAAVTLYRNAVVHAALHSMGQEKSYQQLETALGGPGFGTPRAVDRMTEASRALLGSLPAAAAAAQPVATVPRKSDASPEPAPTTKPAPAAAAPATRPVSAASPGVVRASSRSEPDPLMKAPKKGKKAGKGNEYDPLNGNL